LRETLEAWVSIKETHQIPEKWGRSLEYLPVQLGLIAVIKYDWGPLLIWPEYVAVDHAWEGKLMRADQREVSIQHRVIRSPLEYLVVLIDGNRDLQVVILSGHDHVLVLAAPGVVDLDHIYLLGQFELAIYEEEILLVLTLALVMQYYRLELAIESQNWRNAAEKVIEAPLGSDPSSLIQNVNERSITGKSRGIVWDLWAYVRVIKSLETGLHLMIFLNHLFLIAGGAVEQKREPLVLYALIWHRLTLS
jgi:hypothetical protein